MTGVMTSDRKRSPYPAEEETIIKKMGCGEGSSAPGLIPNPLPHEGLELDPGRTSLMSYCTVSTGEMQVPFPLTLSYSQTYTDCFLCNYFLSLVQGLSPQQNHKRTGEPPKWLHHEVPRGPFRRQAPKSHCTRAPQSNDSVFILSAPLRAWSPITPSGRGAAEGRREWYLVPVSHTVQASSHIKRL